MNDSVEVIMKQCRDIVNDQAQEILNQWLKDTCDDSTLIKQTKIKNAIMINCQILRKFNLQQHKSVCNCLIIFYKHSKRKIFHHLLTLKIWGSKDYQCTFFLKLLTAGLFQKQTIALYLKTRSVVINSILNQKKFQQLIHIVLFIEEWYNLACVVYSHVDVKKLLDKFSKCVKDYYMNKKKDQNQNLNGSQFLLICEQLLTYFSENFNQKKSIEASYVSQQQSKQEVVFLSKVEMQKNEKVLEQKQDKMIEKVVQEVEDLRVGLQKQRQKIKELSERQKYFVYVLKSLKGSFCSLVEVMQRHRKQHESITYLLDSFRDFELGIEQRESKELKEIVNKRQQLRLIQLITEQELYR